MVVDLVMARTYPPKKRSTCDVDNDDEDDGTDEDEGSLFSLFYINTILTINIIILMLKHLVSPNIALGFQGLRFQEFGFRV